jgi:hypothetical protein
MLCNWALETLVWSLTYNAPPTQNSKHPRYIELDDFIGANLSKDVRKKKEMEVSQKKEMEKKREKNVWAFI